MRAGRATIAGAVLLVGGATVLTTCGQRRSEVVAYTSVDQVFSEPILQGCAARAGIEVSSVFDTEETKSTGVVNRLIAEAANPRADVFWSGDPVRPFLLMKREMIEPYVSPNAAAVPAAFKAWDGTWTGFAARARVLLVNTSRVGEGAGPASVRDLADPRWKGQAAMANPMFGTTTMHVAALFTLWGEERAQTFLRAVKANDTRVASSNGEVKRLVTAGEVAFGLTDSDDAHEALQEGAPVEVVYPDQDGFGTLVMPTTVVLVKGPHPDTGRRLVDCLLSPEVEQRLAETAAHMPLRRGVPTPPGVQTIEKVRAMAVDYSQVADTMEHIQPWLRSWMGL